MQKQCKQCGVKFEFTDQDRKNLDKVAPSFGGKKYKFPDFDMCSNCRAQVRFAYRNEWGFYHRKCDHCGVSVISMFDKDSKAVVYCTKCWWADFWDPRDYGRDFDFDRSFFEQFEELMSEVPLPNLVLGDVENSDYTSYSWSNKNCYLTTSSDYNQDCAYASYLVKSKDCFDCTNVHDSELCYQCVDTKSCYACSYMQNCENCNDCSYCYDCRGCKDCLGCVGLRKKQYYIFNEKCTKEEYEKKRAEFFEKNKNFEQLRSQFGEFRLKFPHKFAEIENCENSTGDHLIGCKDCENCFDLVEAEDCKDTAYGYKAKDCFDCTGAPKTEMSYQSVASPEDYAMNVSTVVWPKSSYLNYVVLSRMSNNCFGGVALHKNEYCIMNKQYTKEEYEELVPKIIKHMEKHGEWGKYFPIDISPFAYNETIAGDYYPMSREEVEKNGWRWLEDDSEKMYKGPEYKIPESIDDVDEGICKEILRCEKSGKLFKVTPQELKFYKKMKLPIPKRAPLQRHRDRLVLRNPRMLREGKCEKCGVEFMTAYPKDRPEKLYCEECYLTEVYE